MKTRISICLAVVLLSANMAQAASPVPELELLSRSIRTPVVAVPLLDATKAPVVDGTVSDAEWSGAALLSDTIYDAENSPARGGVATRYRARYWLAYTTEALYVAARFDIPSWAGSPVAKGTQHDATASEDAVDIFLKPGPQPGMKWHLGGNAAGNSYDRDVGDLSVKWRWNPKTAYKARIFRGGWEAEYKIPLAEMNESTPAPGTLWRANFFSVRKMPEGIVSAWSFCRSWQSLVQPQGASDGWLIFSGTSAAARFEHGGNEAGKTGVQIAVTGQPPQTTAEVKAQLYRRNHVPKPSEPGFAATFGNLLEKTTIGGSDTYGMSFDAVRDLALKEYAAQGQPVQQTISADSGDKTVTIHPTEEGEYVLVYSVLADAGKRILAAGSLPFRIEPPVSVTVKPMVLGQGVYQVETDLGGVDLSQAKSVDVTVTRATDGRSVVKQSIPVETALAKVQLAALDWSPGNYGFRSDVRGKTGQALGSAQEQIEKANSPQWWTQPEGLTPEVPEPWKPVEAKVSEGKAAGATISVIGRAYKFAGLPVPASIISTPIQLSTAEAPHKPIEILAAPMELVVTAGSKKLSWQTKDFKIQSQKPSEVVFVSENQAEGVTLKAKTTVEFDGMIRVDFSLASAEQPVKIEKLDLIIPYRREVAELMSTYRKAPGPGSPLQGRYLGKVPTEPWKYSVYYTHFIGNDKVGLEWFCDSMKDWRVKKGDQAVEVRRADDRVNLTFHMVDHEVTLDKPLNIYFGLIATPTKPVRHDPSIFRFDQGAYLPWPEGRPAPKGGKVATKEDTDAWIRRMKYAGTKVNVMFDPGWTGKDWYFCYTLAANPNLVVDRKWQFDHCHELGQKILGYGGWNCVPTAIPEWPLFGAEMIKEPAEGTLQRSFYSCYNSPYTPLQVACFAANARLADIDGVRFDTIAPQPECTSLGHGCGWIGEDGKTYGSQNLFATREFFKRVYRVFHGGVRENGIVYFPAAGPPVMAYDSFVDIHEIGEGSFEHGKTLKEGYPQDDVRVRMTGSAYGFITSNNLKGEPLTINERLAGLLVAGADPRMAFGGHPSWYWRGYEQAQVGLPNFPNTIDIWNAWTWIDRGRTSLWRPYWENQDTIRLTLPELKSGQKPEMYASYYYIPGKKVLLITSNYETEPLSLDVALDLKKLGFKGDEKLYGEDAITREPVELTGGKLTLGMYAQRFRMVKISTDAPVFRDENLGPNLMATGGFEEWPGGVTTGAVLAGQSEAPVAQDTAVRRGGAASLRLTKTVKPTNLAASATLPKVALQPGRYLVSGWIRLDHDLEAAEEKPGSPRKDLTWVQIALAGEGIITDPPKEFSRSGGTFQTHEKTLGWQRFLLPLEATAQAKELTLSITLAGVGNVWFDDVEVREVKNAAR